MICKLRNSRWFKALMIKTTLLFVFQTALPLGSYALTGGPSQPEVQSFEPIGTNQMVDLFSGDFTYNIPLMDVGGYPLNLAYNSGITMDQEASWVGLGWNINPGAITRNVRGLPDDFSGDIIQKDFNMKPNRDFAISGNFTKEIFAFETGSGDNAGTGTGNLTFGLGINFNSYNGLGLSNSLNQSIQLSKNNSDNKTQFGLGVTANSDGLTISPSVGFSAKRNEIDKGSKSLDTGAKVGVQINSRAGLKAMTVSVSGENSGFSDKRAQMETGSSSSLSFNTPTYVPQIDLPFKSSAFSFSGNTGGTFFALSGQYGFVGSFSEQELQTKSVQNPSYGYMNFQEGSTNSSSLLDFNREKEVQINQHAKNLPIVTPSFDIFNISGQGIGGAFRPFRNQLGSVNDAYVLNPSSSGNVSLELEGGNTAHLGGDFDVIKTESFTRRWNNPLSGNLRYASNNDDLFEDFHFQQVGEKTVSSDPSFFNSAGAYDAVSFPLAGSRFNRKPATYLEDEYGNTTPFDEKIYRQNRAKRNQVISHLSAGKVEDFGIEKYRSSDAEDHHIGEISVLRNDGSKYVYGIAAYNKFQKEVSFNASLSNGDCSIGYVGYNNQDASIENNKGQDNYYNAVSTGAYAHSFLLTSVLSSDYVDRTGDGPSDDDFGSYTKFSYDANESVSGTQSSVPHYRWRVPYEDHKANYSEGLKSNEYDDKGSYIYGEKELWYVQKIETKTHIAIFHTSPRTDAKGVKDEHGGYDVSSASMHQLDRVSLYAKPDYEEALLDPSHITIPIKEVHFKYSNELCEGIENSSTNGGKLTLKEVYFTYGNSGKGALNKYKFNYDNPNPNYDLKAYDRWGNYKPNNADGCSPYSIISPAEYPYVEQSQLMANEYVSSWHLSSIQLPSGGLIEVNFESDDYAYVQDKKATQMYKIIGVANQPDVNQVSSRYFGDPISGNTAPNLYMFFDIPDEYQFNSDSDVIDKIVGDLKNEPIYFRSLVDLTNVSDNNELNPAYDYVSGYFELEKNGSNDPIAGIDSGHAYIKVKPVTTAGDGNLNAHPISKAAWHFAQQFNPRKAFNLPDPPGAGGNNNFLQQAWAVIQNGNLLSQAADALIGPNQALKEKHYGSLFVPQKSWIRLYNPIGKKFGGGSRVESVKIYDNWQLMDEELSEGDTYGQEYSYLLPNGNSSGVASYEPVLGGDENPFREPVYTDIKKLLAADEKHYSEKPFGESLFPSASVGYSRIEVKDISKDGVEKNATGYVVNEFYTSKDFPTRAEHTNLNPNSTLKFDKHTNPILNFFRFDSKEHLTASQGYVVELNDMHGKQKAQWIYDNYDNRISGVEYFYETENIENEYANINSSVTNNSNVVEKLSNKVLTINKDGNIVENEIGVEFEFLSDFNRSKTQTDIFQTQGNTIAFLAAVFPIVLPPVYPTVSTQTKELKTATTTKVINRYGLLREVKAYDLNSVVSTKNLLYDGETGEVLLTETVNAFDDPVYSFSYPAHWAYQGMEQAYISQGLALENLNFGNAGNLVYPNSIPDGIFMPGDVLGIIPSNGTNPFKAWVSSVNTNNNELICIDEQGNLIPELIDVSVQILEPGRKNQQAMAIGSIVTKKNPIEGNALIFDASKDILTATASEYRDDWNTFMQTCPLETNTTILSVVDLINALVDEHQFGVGIIDPPVDLSQPPYDGIMNNLNASGFYANSCNYFTYDGENIICVDNDPNNVDQGCKLNPITPYDPSTVDQMLLSNVLINQTQTGNGQTYPYNPGGYTLVFDGYFNGNLVVQDILVESNGCFEIDIDCPELAYCLPQEGETVNPFLMGLRGNWKPLRSHTYLADREQSADLNSREDGVFSDFTNTFWNSPNSGEDWTIDNTNWTSVTEITEYHPFGAEVENRNALGIYSSAQYGYNFSIPTAVGANAEYNEIAFDNFEDYDFNCSVPHHFKFEQHQDNISDQFAHSGLFSLEVSPGTNNAVSTLRILNQSTDDTPVNGPIPAPYLLSNADNVGLFGPSTFDDNGTPETKQFLLSYWVRETHAIGEEIFDFNNHEFSILLNGNPIAMESYYNSPIIDGWQKRDYKFTLDAGMAGAVEFQIVNNLNSGNNIHIDDVRVLPFDGSMKSYVYHPYSYRLVAELDDNNFATFYEYDEEGSLIRVKKETERGIKTIQEGRNHKYQEPLQ